MPMKKPSNPWRLVLHTPGGPIYDSRRSERAAYDAVTAEKARIANGSSRVSRIHVQKWNVEKECWDLYECAYPES